MTKFKDLQIRLPIPWISLLYDYPHRHSFREKKERKKHLSWVHDINQISKLCIAFIVLMSSCAARSKQHKLLDRRLSIWCELNCNITILSYSSSLIWCGFPSIHVLPLHFQTNREIIVMINNNNNRIDSKSYIYWQFTVGFMTTYV